jgi:polyphosphate kinase 2 (PPK2 family)
VVEANDKFYARVKVVKTVVSAIEAVLPKKAKK